LNRSLAGLEDEPAGLLPAERRTPLGTMGNRMNATPSCPTNGRSLTDTAPEPPGAAVCVEIGSMIRVEIPRGEARG